MPTCPARISLLLFCGCALPLTSGASPQTGRDSRDEVPEGLSAVDWANIRAAHKAGRRAAYPADGGYRARNPGQYWTTHFDGCGSRTEPDAGGWTWGLELESYGFADGEQPVRKPARVSAEGGRVAYQWDASLEEWYINDARGLEHGYTVQRAPARNEDSGESPLTFTLAVRGELRADVTADGRSVDFMNEDGSVVLTYAGLSVLDADGRELRASFECVADHLRLSIEERGARYPLTIDPIAQQTYLKASNTGYFDHFGWSVAVSGDTVVVGAPFEGSNATGVNGDQGDNTVIGAGAAYVFVRSGTSWSQQAYLKASNTDGSDLFGLSVGVSGDTVVVGAMNERSSATGVNGNQSDNSLAQAGAAYVFVRSGTSWSQQAYLKASNAGYGDNFGWSLSISGETLVVGAINERSNATGVNGDQSDNSAWNAGAAYVFVRRGTSWTQEAYLKASNAEGSSSGGDSFGMSVAACGDMVVVGAPAEDSGATGVNGNQSDNGLVDSGAAYVFVRSGSSWSQQAYLKASNTGGVDNFGESVAVSGGTVVVGADREDSNATGVNGDQLDNSADYAGAAYVFVQRGTSWSQQAYLKASNAEWGDGFGTSVSMSGDTLVVGAINESSSATGVNGDQSDNSTAQSGAAYVFERRGTSWSQQGYLKASNPGVLDLFGWSAAVSGGTVVVGAVYEDSRVSGIDGNGDDNSAYAAGAVYVFDFSQLSPPGVPFCFGDPGAGTPCPCSNDNDGSVPGSGCANGAFASGAQLVGSGVASLTADTLILATTGLEPSNSGLYFQANNDLSPGNTWGDGLQCAGGQLKRLGVRFSDATGYSDTSGYSLPISMKAGNVSPGDTKYYQCWYRNPNGSPCGIDFNASNGYAVTWLP
jgi:hypothetical protein